MTLKHMSECGIDREWSKMKIYHGCISIIKVAVEGLVAIEPFNNRGKEYEALVNFKSNADEKLVKLLFNSQNGLPKPFNPEEATTCIKELNALTKTLTSMLKNQELRKVVYSVLMTACGLILGIFAAIPLGIPLCFSSVRNYIGSFFVPPEMPAQKIQMQLQTAITQIQKVLSKEIECFMDKKNGESCFNNIPLA